MPLDTQKIKSLRLKAGLSQADAADRAGMGRSRQAWSNLENGRDENISLDRLERIAKALGVKARDLLK